MLLDTSGLFCFHDRRSEFHRPAVDAFTDATHRFLHNYIVDELISLATARRLPRQPVLDFVDDLQSASAITFVWVDEPLHSAAIRLLRARPDKSYSLCDAVSFVLMRAHQLDQALTTDRHFEQEGFVRLLI